MRDTFPVFFHRLERARLRRFCAFYLLAFLVSVAASPHRHANSLQDLLSDGRSDSGTFFQSSPPLDSDPAWSCARFVDDDPCLACFHNDWATEAISFLDLSPFFQPIPIVLPGHAPGLLSAPSRSASSRGPPRSL